jgi:ABC-2 type transport system permease protein
MFDKRDARSYIENKWVLGIWQTLAIVSADISKLRHDPTELFTRMLQPAIWLIIFGQAMAKSVSIPTGGTSYLNYVAPGILAQSVLFIAIFYGINLIWERDLGVVHKILVTPAPRIALVTGRGIAAGIRSLSQLIVIYAIAFLLGIDLRLDWEALFGIIAMVLLAGTLFSTFSLIAACIVKKRERFMGIGQVLIMPLFFASNALYPIDQMPGWLQIVSKLNPLMYQVDAMRTFMIQGEISHFGLTTDFGVTFAVLAVLLLIAAPMYPKILY